MQEVVPKREVFEIVKVAGEADKFRRKERSAHEGLFLACRRLHTQVSAMTSAPKVTLDVSNGSAITPTPTSLSCAFVRARVDQVEHIAHATFNLMTHNLMLALLWPNQVPGKMSVHGNVPLVRCLAQFNNFHGLRAVLGSCTQHGIRQPGPDPEYVDYCMHYSHPDLDIATWEELIVVPCHGVRWICRVRGYRPENPLHSTIVKDRFGACKVRPETSSGGQ